MFRVIRLEDKSVRPVLSSRLILDKGQAKLYWPLRGVSFKLKNLVDPPLELNIEERKDWKLIRCDILLNEEFSTFDEANMAALHITNQGGLDLKTGANQKDVQKSKKANLTMEKNNFEQMDKRHGPVKNMDKLESMNKKDERDSNMYSCQECSNEDTSSMVQCDVCKLWSHFECAGVDENIENFAWSCLLCREKALKKREEEVEKKENEVDMLIEEAKEFIKNEFEAKKLSFERMENDMRERENALVQREERVKEREEFLSVRNEKDRNTVEEEMGAAGELNKTNFLEAMPVGENYFVVWDKMLVGKQDDMKNFYLGINLKEETDFIKECINQTFADDFILKIKFDIGNPFNNTNILRYMIASVQTKFENKNYDNKEARGKIVSAFKQFRNTNSKRNKK